MVCGRKYPYLVKVSSGRFALDLIHRVTSSLSVVPPAEWYIVVFLDKESLWDSSSSPQDSSVVDFGIV